MQVDSLSLSVSYPPHSIAPFNYTLRYEAIYHLASSNGDVPDAIWEAKKMELKLNMHSYTRRIDALPIAPRLSKEDLPA